MYITVVRYPPNELSPKVLPPNEHKNTENLLHNGQPFKYILYLIILHIKMLFEVA